MFKLSATSAVVILEGSMEDSKSLSFVFSYAFEIIILFIVILSLLV